MMIINFNKLLTTISIYLCVSILLSIYNVSIYINIINPIFWLITGIYGLCIINKNYYKIEKNKKYIICLLILLIIYITFWFALGLNFGFVLSPYNHNINYFFKNLFIQIIPVCAIEIIRELLIKNNKRKKIMLILSTLILMFLEINYSSLFNIDRSKREIFKYVCSYILPIFSSSILYSYLTFKNSYILPITIRLIKGIVILSFPVFSDLDWFMVGALYIILNAIMYFIFEYKIFKIETDVKLKRINNIKKRRYIFFFIFYILLFCFMIGLFRYEPVTILSNSMVPTFSRGDVVIFEKTKEIEPNSIIVFENNNQTIIHRVIDIKKLDDTIYYETKGDSNNVPDSKLICEDKIKGVYRMHIKYLGFPSIWLYEYFKN